MMDVAIVKYAFVSISKPTINIWCPQTMQPKNAIINIAINMESLPKIRLMVYFDINSLIKPNAGKIKIYTSGWPKNQNKCWKYILSPPLIGSKNDVLKCLSNITIVMHPAKTGKDKISKNEVKNNDQLKRERNNKLYCIDNEHALNIVTIKLIDPNNELKPRRCKEKNNKSMAEWFIIDRGT